MDHALPILSVLLCIRAIGFTFTKTCHMSTCGNVATSQVTCLWIYCDSSCLLTRNENGILRNFKVYLQNLTQIQNTSDHISNKLLFRYNSISRFGGMGVSKNHYANVPSITIVRDAIVSIRIMVLFWCEAPKFPLASLLLTDKSCHANIINHCLQHKSLKNKNRIY